jgi:hypothetical protein
MGGTVMIRFVGRVGAISTLAVLFNTAQPIAQTGLSALPVSKSELGVEEVRARLSGSHFKYQQRQWFFDRGEMLFPAFEAILADPKSEPLHVARAMFILSGMNTDRQRFLKFAVGRLEDSSGEVRRGVVQLLGQIGSEREAGRILPLLTDRDTTVSYTAVGTLAAIGGEREFAALGAWLNSPHRYLLDAHYRDWVSESLKAMQKRLATKPKAL